MDIGLLSAFIGGLLALLSPCGALLLPAFFASTVGSGPRLWLHGVAFYVGLVSVLVPLGFGFDAAPFLPGRGALQIQAEARAGLVETALLGAAKGGGRLVRQADTRSRLTLAAVQGDVVTAGTLLAVYGAGMVVALAVLAVLWGRIGMRTRALLRGRTVTVLGREVHSVSVATGLLILAFGILFWTTSGPVGGPELLPGDVQAGLQTSLAVVANPVVDVIVLVALAGIGLLVWDRMRRRGRATVPETGP